MRIFFLMNALYVYAHLYTYISYNSWWKHCFFFFYLFKNVGIRNFRILIIDDLSSLSLNFSLCQCGLALFLTETKVIIMPQCFCYFVTWARKDNFCRKLIYAPQQLFDIAKWRTNNTYHPVRFLFQWERKYLYLYT